MLAEIRMIVKVVFFPLFLDCFLVFMAQSEGSLPLLKIVLRFFHLTLFVPYGTK